MRLQQVFELFSRKNRKARQRRLRPRHRVNRRWLRAESLEPRRMLATFIDLQNFENAAVPALPAEWQTSGTGNNPWITVAGTSDSLPNHAFVQNVETISDSMLISPVFLASQQMSKVHFRNSYDTESGFDGGVLEISVNGGPFEDITIGGAFLAGGYNATLNTGFGSALSGRAAWSGGSRGYIDTIATLPEAALGQPVQLRWRMATDTNEQSLKVGWRIDTIRVSPVNGSGIFANDSESLQAVASNDVHLGDLDSDGDLDAFVVNGFGTDRGNRIWINQAGLQGGTAGTFSDSGQSLGPTTRDVSLGDVDGDGDLDAFAAIDRGRPNGVWLNQGGLQSGTEGIFSDSGQSLGNSDSNGVSLGDLDGDGDLDAFVANGRSQGDRVWINQAGSQGGIAGTFSDSGQSLGYSSTHVDLGDLDGDGDLDAFVANRFRDQMWINEGGLQGGLEGIFTESGQSLGTDADVSLNDMDGDGDLDTFVVGPTGNRVLFNRDLDFGDAPDTFRTTLANDGARHAPTGPILGSFRDGESDGQPSSGATDDDLSDTGSSDDEDGVTFSPTFAGQSNAIANVSVTVEAGRLDAWIDFNGDGTFDDANEQIAGAHAVSVGDNPVVFNVPATAVPGQPLIARFRISTEGGLGPRGAAADGEVEDHTVNLQLATATGHNINGVGNPNRSGIANLMLRFDGAATVADVPSLNVFNHTTGAPLDISAATLHGNGTASITWDFSNVSFPDGYYTAELPKSAATVTATHAIQFHVLAGDGSGDARVGFADFGGWANTFNLINGPKFGPGDFDGDGDVGFSDFGILARNFNRMLTSPLLDFGDAPEAGTSFPATLANNGARHIVGSGLSLGATVDAEADGQPNATASGDGSDEDGATFAALQAGAMRQSRLLRQFRRQAY